MYQKFAPMRGPKLCGLIGRLCLKVSGAKKLARDRAAFYSVQVSGTSLLSVSHLCKDVIASLSLLLDDVNARNERKKQTTQQPVVSLLHLFSSHE